MHRSFTIITNFLKICREFISKNNKEQAESEQNTQENQAPRVQSTPVDSPSSSQESSADKRLSSNNHHSSHKRDNRSHPTDKHSRGRSAYKERSPRRGNEPRQRREKHPSDTNRKQHVMTPLVDHLPNHSENSPLPIFIPREEHPISRRDISKNALKVLYRLKDNGYEAYLVGGCIRDLLLGMKPKDFDVVTNAKPEEIKALFTNCRLIGRRFRLAHIVYGRDIIEVATFRGHHDATAPDLTKDQSNQSKEGMLLRDNIYGSIDEDAQRRDFSINALYYSINDFSLRDYAHGVNAIKSRRVEIIGDPETRYREDPVRMLRAIRFATKLEMTIAAKTEAPMFELGHLLTSIPPARLYEESLKLFLAGKSLDNYLAMRKYNLFEYLFPVVFSALDGDEGSKEERLIKQVFINTDERINNDKKVNPAFLFAAILWYPLETFASRISNESGLNYYDAFQIAMNDVLDAHCRNHAIPRRFTSVMRDIWGLQLRLPKNGGRKAYRLVEHPKFRAGYDFLLIRGQIEGGTLRTLGEWWTEFQDADEEARQQLTSNTPNKNNSGNTNRRSRRQRNYRRPRQNKVKNPQQPE